MSCWRDVDDREAAVCEPQATIDELAIAVRPAMRQRLAHPTQDDRRGGSAIRFQETRDSTHR
jgi:hypothetical protein